MSEGRGRRVEAGDLLVATAALLDPNFEHAVVLVLDADENGALGVVLNRPSTVPVREVLPDWTDVAGEPDVLFQGGPVSTDSALAVAASTTYGVDPDVEPVGFRRLYADVGIVDLDTPTEIVAPALTGLRIFAGYAGWGAGQLEAEIAEGSWYVVPAETADLLTGEAERLWRQVLRRQPGELAFVATCPADPSQN
jgi:putative transcriptional regulator